MKKKVLALLLAVLLAVGALPMAALADGEEGPSGSGTAGSLNWKVENWTLTVSGNGAIPDYSPRGESEDNLPPWASVGFSTGKDAPAQAFVIEPGVTRIGQCAFSYLGCKALYIPDTVTFIGRDAFLYSGCGDGTNVMPMDFLSIPGSVKTIDGFAFYGFGAKSIALHEGTESIGSSAFSSYALESIYLPASLRQARPIFGGAGVVIKDIYYAGSEAEFKANGLTNLGYEKSENPVTIHYNTPAPDSPVTPPVGGFTDVPAGEYYAEPVKWAVENKITAGETDTTFAPNKTCTRGQIVTFLWRANGEPEPASALNTFSDVKAGDYYYKAVLWAKENGITQGETDTTFAPNAPCNRGQAVTFLWRANSQPAGGNSSFGDVKEGEYYTEAVKWAVAFGITQGETSTAFAPGKSCTRGQIVTFLYRDKA